jgi:hypothetical protein
MIKIVPEGRVTVQYYSVYYILVFRKYRHKLALYSLPSVELNSKWQLF